MQGKVKKLEAFIAAGDDAIVAFSGGVDSSYLLKVTFDTLSSDGKRTLALIGISASLPQSERHAAQEVARQIGVSLREIKTDEMGNANYVANEADRCYHCKSVLFGTINEIAQKEKYAVIYDGTNSDDLADVRPGRQAATERNVASPLMEAGLTKADIRQLSKEAGLPTWDKPEMACLASRVPTGVMITGVLLHKIERAEEYLKSLGFRIVRVRSHGDMARIELGADEIARAATKEMSTQIDAHLKSLGYKQVVLNLKPYSR